MQSQRNCAKKPDKRGQDIHKHGFAAAVGGKKDDRAAALDEAQGVEAVNGRVKKRAQGVIGQAVKTKEKGDEDNKGESDPCAVFGPASWLWTAFGFWAARLSDIYSFRLMSVQGLNLSEVVGGGSPAVNR